MGRLVAKCIAEGQTLERCRWNSIRNSVRSLIEDIYEAISLETCVQTRISEGGTSKASVEQQIAYVRDFLAKV